MRLLRKPEVEAKVGLCERRFRELERDNLFPRRVTINPNGKGRAVGWIESEVDQWLADRMAAREAA
ncbi:helix-turn-helix transcriptional regulator [Sphingosinicella microcystinivorans]|uniref:helix-turn-helix transcriptional regulator n=1 Tax=Sphingosinicella microcystinivorans TaxID=335406 RepID=UPI0022F38869|nr:AlpA family phage regulatory protein [Sphingosinicella microcystinivorans]WBX83201.1 AlpA family phage regulatory protein [Sphingosinicella microcystinivorans]